MPAQRPRAAFEPLSPDLNVSELVNSTPNFEQVVRIQCDAIDENGLENFEKLVLLHVIVRGLPLVIEGFDKKLDNAVFSDKWLRNHYSAKQEQARDLTAKRNVPLTIGHYLKNMPMLTKQWTRHNYKDPDLQRLYLKDIDCPKIWHDYLKKVIPPFLFYLNKSAEQESFEGPGAKTTARSSKTRHNAMGKQLVAKSGDLMSCLPPDMRADNLMCYIGHEGTYTPAHQEMCASLGQNLMVNASDGSMEDGEITRPGSSIWFMTSSKDRKLVSEYWNSVLGHDVNIEDHFAQINAWKAAPFTTYLVEQRPGDFILVPPLAAHQVWNRGTRTMKVAWNRTTVETLERALNEALPHARMVCRDEQYKNKAIVFYTLKHYSALLGGVDEANAGHPRIQQLQNEFEQLFALYDQIILSESFSATLPKEKNVEYIPFDSNITCSYCRGNIFNRFLTCPSCAVGPDDAYDICMECYAMGRSCACISRLKWAEQFRWNDLTEKHETWRQQVLKVNPALGEKFRPLREEFAEMSRKSLAQVCQEELKRRPWVDITKPAPVPVPDESLEEPEQTGPPAKKRKTSRADKSKAPRCHICKYVEPTWKLASCSNPKCSLKYCYGSLYRAFNMLPQEILEMKRWECPRCRKICSCGACRKNPKMTPFEPTSTSLGHDTSKVADPRSVESLVDFRHSNLGWLKKAGSDEVGRLRKHQEEADAKRNQALEDNSIQVEFYADMSQPYDYSQLELAQVAQAAFHADYADNIPVDPALESSHLAPVDSLG
ncbi:hypothetical protein BJY00DRAFT_45623 [Aspergillus carlsbadensis]|nr:hypothetical protein BJY00DRAFT_45623 [Aspergillus carlsbadensis]